MILTPEGEVAAVVDWELCTLGDPLADVGLLMVYWPKSGEEATSLGQPANLAPGFPDRDELRRRYAERSGRDLSRLDFYVALGYWKLAIILEGVYARYTAGGYGKVDEGVEYFANVVERLAEAADQAEAACTPEAQLRRRLENLPDTESDRRPRRICGLSGQLDGNQLRRIDEGDRQAAHLRERGLDHGAFPGPRPGAPPMRPRVAKKSVGPSQLKANAVTTAKIKANAMTTRKIKRNAVANAKIKDGAVESEKIADGSVSFTDLASTTMPFSRVVRKARGSSTAGDHRSGENLPPERSHLHPGGERERQLHRRPRRHLLGRLQSPARRHRLSAHRRPQTA